ncbi:hypothetical protein K8I28_16150 [bacterium]|nr:hypothetical protein [bacterium]
MNNFKQEKKKYKKKDEEKEYSQIPPSDLQAEQAVLGAILLDPLAYEKISDLITGDSFYWKKHKIIFKAISDLAGENEPTDLVSVSTRLTANEKLSDIGGDYYLTELTELVSFPRNVDYYATIVKQKYVLREVLNIGEELGKSSYDPSTEAGGLIDWGISELFTLQKSDERSGYKKIDKVAGITVENIQELSEREGAYTGVSSGFRDLDDKTGGFQKSDLIILAARPSMGKTSLALSFAFNAALYSKVPVGIISLEMSSKQIAMRMMSFVSGIPLYQIRDARIPDEDWTRIPEAAGKLSDLPI